MKTLGWLSILALSTLCIAQGAQDYRKDGGRSAMWLTVGTTAAFVAGCLSEKGR